MPPPSPERTQRNDVWTSTNLIPIRHGQEYYHNDATGETTWSKPAGMSGQTAPRQIEDTFDAEIQQAPISPPPPAA